MRLLCPACSEPIIIADELAGRSTNCPLCLAPITIPPLYSSGASSSTGDFGRGEGMHRPDDVRRDEAGSPSEPEGSPDADSADRRISIPLSSDIARWIAPVLLGIVVLLTLFFDWNGAFPGGHAVYTQGAFRALFGRIYIDPDGENVFKANPVKPPEGQVPLKDQVRSNLLLLLIIPLIFLTFGAAVLVAASPEQVMRRLPPALQPWLAWKTLLVAALAGATFVLLAIQSLRGFGLENAIRENARAEVERTQKLPDYPSESDFKRREILEGSLVGRFQVRQTTALKFVLVLLFLSVAASLYSYGLADRRGPAAPRLELRW